MTTANDKSLYFKRVHSKAILPTKSTDHAAGYDLYAYEDGVVPARGKALIPSGWCIRLPEGHYGRINPRSSLAWKHSIDIGAGVIDMDFSLEFGIILFNHSDQNFNYKAGERVAQLIIEVCRNDLVPIEVDQLPAIQSNREGGFGSTGK